MDSTGSRVTIKLGALPVEAGAENEITAVEWSALAAPTGVYTKAPSAPVVCDHTTKFCSAEGESFSSAMAPRPVSGSKKAMG